MIGTVVWNGRRDGPGGAQLFTPEEVPHTPPPGRQARHTRRAQVLGSLRGSPRTLAQLAAALACTTAEIDGVVYALRKAGRVTVVREIPAHGRRWGRGTTYVYGLAGGGL